MAKISKLLELARKSIYDFEAEKTFSLCEFKKLSEFKFEPRHTLDEAIFFVLKQRTMSLYNEVILGCPENKGFHSHLDNILTEFGIPKENYGETEDGFYGFCRDGFREEFPDFSQEEIYAYSDRILKTAKDFKEKDINDPTLWDD